MFLKHSHIVFKMIKLQKQDKAFLMHLKITVHFECLKKHNSFITVFKTIKWSIPLTFP